MITLILSGKKDEGDRGGKKKTAEPEFLKL
jgi:hypothetical protein